MIIRINLEQIIFLLNLFELKSKSSIEDEMQIIVAAKRVDVVDGYAEQLNIDKFDLVIDWGFLYFITKPFFMELIISLNYLEIMD